nr:hypothetical protein [Tanacetum cinerariifolium]
MANLLEDIQCVGSDTRPPMLDRTEFASKQQRIQLYCRGKENGVNILKSIDEGPFQMGTVWETLAEGTEGAPYLGPERPRVYSDLSPEEKDRGIIHGVEVQLGMGEHRTKLNFNYFKDKMLLMQAQENEVTLDEEQLLFLADDYDAFDSDVDEALMAQTMSMANLSSVDHVYDEAGPSYDLDILYEELYSVKLQLAFTINHNKLMVEEVTSLKKDFKQKENKYLEDFLDMKSLKEKVEDRLFKQDQSLQTVHMLCRPKPYYNELNNVAIGYKNPLCLTRSKQVQPTLYNGHEIIKNNHVPAIVHNTEDTLEIAKITRRKMNDKMKDPECVKHKVKIAPHDYSKENFLATFTPKKQLTPEQIFWSQDLIKMKTTALKEQTTASRPIKALTVYPPNIPTTLVHGRITPTGLTDGERGFEQTKECYLKEVIPFFKTLKENFEGIQKALTKEIKEMKDVFEELEAEVAQNVVDRKHDEIERKNLLTANDNLIAECLSKEVFYVATNFKLNCQILFVFNKGMDGLGEFFPHPFCMINMGSTNDALENLHGSDNFRVTQIVNKVNESIRCWWGREWIVVVDWCDLKSVSECFFDTMADVNVNAPAEQAPDMTPPTRTDDQILPRSRWVSVGKSNCYLDVEKSQRNPIYKIAMDILKHTNFFIAFTAFSTIPSIYIQQFWDTIRYDRDTAR